MLEINHFFKLNQKRSDFIGKQKIYIGSIFSKSSIGKRLKSMAFQNVLPLAIFENDQMSIWYKLKGLELCSVVTHYTFWEFSLLFTYPGLLIHSLDSFRIQF
jgi:hypothetical protein